MKFFSMLANDPVVMFAIGGLGITVAICLFYLFYFMKHINEDKK